MNKGLRSQNEQKMSFLGEGYITKEINSMEDILTIHIPDEIRHKYNNHRTPEEMCVIFAFSEP